MLCPRAKEKGENKNRTTYVARNEKFGPYGFLVYHAEIFHVCNSAMVSLERTFQEVTVQPLWPDLLHARVINNFLMSLEFQDPTSKASTVISKTSIQKSGLTP